MYKGYNDSFITIVGAHFVGLFVASFYVRVFSEGRYYCWWKKSG